MYCVNSFSSVYDKINNQCSSKYIFVLPIISDFDFLKYFETLIWFGVKWTIKIDFRFKKIFIMIGNRSLTEFSAAILLKTFLLTIWISIFGQNILFIYLFWMLSPAAPKLIHVFWLSFGSNTVINIFQIYAIWVCWKLVVKLIKHCQICPSFSFLSSELDFSAQWDSNTNEAPICLESMAT